MLCDLTPPPVDVGDTVFYVHGAWVHDDDEPSYYDAKYDMLHVLSVGKNGKIACAGYKYSRNGVYFEYLTRDQIVLSLDAATQWVERMRAEKMGSKA